MDADRFVGSIQRGTCVQHLKHASGLLLLNARWIGASFMQAFLRGVVPFAADRVLTLFVCAASIAICYPATAAADVAGRVPITVELPTVIHECDSNCNTLTLVNRDYVVPAQPWEHPPGPVIWHIESFTPDLVALHRTFPVDQVFRGRIGPDGESLVDVTLSGRPASEIRFAWGRSIGMVAGSNAERDQRARAGIRSAPPAGGTVINSGNANRATTATPSARATTDEIASIRAEAEALAKPLGKRPAGVGPRPGKMLDLNGDWFMPNMNSAGEKWRDNYRIQLAGDVVKMMAVAPGQAWDGKVRFEGRYLPSQKLVGNRIVPAAGEKPAGLLPTVFEVSDPDQLEVVGEFKIYRTEPSPSVPTCDEDNSSGTRADPALYRAWKAAGSGQAPLAVCWLKVAANEGDTRAMESLANRFAKGLGVPKDEREALMWIAKGALLNDAYCMGQLSNRYANGIGVEKDEVKMRYWMEATANQNFSNIMNSPQGQATLDLAGKFIGAITDHSRADAIDSLVRRGMSRSSAENTVDNRHEQTGSYDGD